MLSMRSACKQEAGANGVGDAACVKSMKVGSTLITPIFAEIRDSFKHPAPSRRCAVRSHRPASDTLPHDKAGVPGLSWRWACGGAALVL